MNYKQAFQYAGGRNGLAWKHGPPRQTRAADTVALGSVLSGPTLVLPRPGAPEVMLGDAYLSQPRGGVTRAGMNGMGGCGCKGSCGCSSSMGDVALGSLLPYAAAGALAYFLFFRKRR